MFVNCELSVSIDYVFFLFNIFVDLYLNEFSPSFLISFRIPPTMKMCSHGIQTSKSPTSFPNNHTKQSVQPYISNIRLYFIIQNNPKRIRNYNNE